MQDNISPERTLAGAPKMGWLCSYTPIEILLAAGFLPVRLHGRGAAVGKAETAMHPNICHFVKSTLETGLAGGFGHLDGVVFVSSCDAMRRLADVWRAYVPTNFIHVMDLPRGAGDAEIAYLADEYKKLISALETHFHAIVPGVAIRQAGDELNAARAMFDDLSALRKQTPPRVTGKEVARMAELSGAVPPALWLQSARAFLELKKDETPPAEAPSKPRIILSGSPMHDPELIGQIEDCGLNIVSEDLCTSSRHFSTRVTFTGDAAADLARAYLTRPPCPRMMSLDARMEYITGMARDYNAQGVIHYVLKFCDTALYDVPVLKQRLEAEGLRVLCIEGDGTAAGFGPLKTRIEAFAEMLSDV